MSSGIYQIENKVNSKVYIGSSNNIERRWQKHKALLRHGKHQNSHLQAAWNKYGEDNFIFSIIELCSIDSLLDREQYFINMINPEYNQTLVAGKVEMTTDRRKKLSCSIAQAYKDGKMQRIIKTIYQYDLKGNYIREYTSLGEASNALNIPLSNLSCAAHGKCNIAGGYVWRFYKVDKLDVWFNRMGRPITKEPYRKKSRSIVACKGDEVLRFSSTKEAVLALGCTNHQLYKALTLGRLLFKTIKVSYE